MLSSIEEWKITFDKLSKNNKTIKNLSDFLDISTTGKLNLSDLTFSEFIFNKQIMEKGLLTLKVYSDLKVSNKLLSDIWEQAIIGSQFIITPGVAVTNPPITTPATIFSVVTPPILEIISLSQAKFQLYNDLNLLKSEKDNKNFLLAFYNAFLNLRYTISGFNSINPIPTPLSLISKTI
jgi:hypothetical protein